MGCSNSVAAQESKKEVKDNQNKTQGNDIKNSDINNNNKQIKISVNRIDDNNQLERIDQNFKPQLFQIIKELEKNGSLYNDEQFIANNNSICTDPSDTRYSKFQKCQWKRVKEILGDEVVLFDKIDPDDISQGGLGVCYFLCSLSILAENGKYVIKCFNTDKVNNHGVYSVNFYILGYKQEVIVDDLFPSYRNKFSFSQPKGNEIWVLLLEKAWCKLFKKYTVAEGGLPQVALEYLTGAPSYSYNSDNNEDMWKNPQLISQMFLSYEIAHFFSAAGSKTFSEEKNNGIVGGHAYSILQVNEYNNDVIIKLRNPWGNTEFQGKYSESSELWKDEKLCQLFQFVAGNDGIFYMNIQEFVQYFDQFTVCYIKENYQIQETCKLNLKNEEECFLKMDVDLDKQNICLRLHQMLKYIVHEDGYEYSKVQFRIFKMGNQVELISDGESYRQQGFHSILHSEKVFTEFTKGSYMIYIKVYWHNNIQRNITISGFSDQPVHFNQLDSVTGKQVISDYVLQLCQKSVLSQKQEGKVKGLQYCKVENDRQNVIYVKNTNKDIKIILKYTLANMQNYSFYNPENNSTSNEVLAEVLPDQYQLFFMQPIDYYQGYNYKLQKAMQIESI